MMEGGFPKSFRSVLENLRSFSLSYCGLVGRKVEVEPAISRVEGELGRKTFRSVPSVRLNWPEEEGGGEEF